MKKPQTNDRAEGGIEHRTVAAEVRMTEPKTERSIATMEGHAAIFDTRSELLGGWFIEVIAKGAFDDVLGDDVRALVDHETNKILGRKSAGTMDFGVDDKGLWYSCDIPDTSFGRDLVVSMQRDDIRESSFGFSVDGSGEEWEVDEEGRHLRTITKVKRLYDVSPVAFPAYADTDVALRSLQRFQDLPAAPKGKRDGNFVQTLAHLVDSKTDDQHTRAHIVSELAKAAGIDESRIESILEGATTPSQEQVYAFSEVLEAKPNDLIDSALSDGIEIKSDKEVEDRGRIILLEATVRNQDARYRELHQFCQELKSDQSRIKEIAERTQRRFGAFRGLYAPLLNKLKA